MLIACQTCHRQYDVGALQPGERVRCYCGELNVVPEPQVRDADLLNCSACGGDVRSDAKECEYCGKQLLLADKGMGDACPECFARLVRGARFCSGCGTPIQPQTVRKVAAGTACPRCDAALALCEIPGGAFTECTECGGIWLEERDFLQATRKQERSTVARYFQTKPGAEAPAPRKRDSEQLVQYLACPVCEERMNRKNFAGCSGVIIDWCKGHGYWFDTDELEQIMDFISAGGLEKARRRQVDEQRHQERMARMDRGFREQREQSRGPYSGPPGRIVEGHSVLDVLLSVLSSVFR